MKKNPRRLWQFQLRNKFTLLPQPLCFVFGTSPADAQKHLWHWIDKPIYEIVDYMPVDNPDLIIISDFVVPDIRNLNDHV